MSLFRARRAELLASAAEPRADAQLPQPRAAAGGRQRRLRRALRGLLAAARRRAGERRARRAAGRAAAQRPQRLGGATGARRRRSAGLPHATLWRQAEARMLAAAHRRAGAGGQARAGEVVVLLRCARRPRASTSARCSCAACARWRRVGAFWEHQQVARPAGLPARAGQPAGRAGAVLGARLAARGRSRSTASRCSPAPRASRAGRVGDRSLRLAGRRAARPSSAERPTSRRSRRFCELLAQRARRRPRGGRSPS